MLMPRSAFYTMVFFSVVIALVSYRFIFLGLSPSFPGMSGHIDKSLFAFVLHITLAPVALLLGVVQFYPAIRTKIPVLHRWVGRVYGFCVVLAGVAGLWVAMGAEGGIVATVGFALLACVWIFVTLFGIAHAREGRIAEHRRWMMRSFALTLAAVTLRLHMLGFMSLGMEYTEASVYLAWSCWVPNIIGVEWWLRRQNQSYLEVRS